MLEHQTPTLLPPALNNSSCWPTDAGHKFTHWPTPGPGQLLRATLILFLSIGILVANLLVICVINSRRYSKYIHAQVSDYIIFIVVFFFKFKGTGKFFEPKYLLTSLASNDLAIGVLVTPFGFLPAVYGCWPYGEVVCQIQLKMRRIINVFFFFFFFSSLLLALYQIFLYLCCLSSEQNFYHNY
ncbi:GSCOCG00013542001-RA-CDS, partial [Cotesia congregata]